LSKKVEVRFLSPIKHFTVPTYHPPYNADSDSALDNDSDGENLSMKLSDMKPTMKQWSARVVKVTRKKEVRNSKVFTSAT